VSPHSTHPAVQAADADLQALGAYLAGLRATSAKKGKALYDQYKCALCHAIGGKGGKFAPALDYAGAGGREADWQFKHLKNPKSQVPNSFMPAFTGPDADARAIVDYLMTLRPRKPEPERPPAAAPQ